MGRLLIIDALIVNLVMWFGILVRSSDPVASIVIGLLTAGAFNLYLTVTETPDNCDSRFRRWLFP